MRWVKVCEVNSMILAGVPGHDLLPQHGDVLGEFTQNAMNAIIVGMVMVKHRM